MAAEPQRPIIGGMFGLELDGRAGSDGKPLGENDLLLANGRCAIHTVVQQLVPPRVWLPSYLCGVLIDTVAATGAPIHFYEIGGDLRPTGSDWLEAVEVGDVVVTIDFFGFPADAVVANAANRRGAWVLRDACQTLVTRRLVGAGTVDFAVFSPRKHLGVPDGGVLRILSDRPEAAALRAVPLAPAPDAWWEMAHECSLARLRFDREGGDRVWHTLFQQSEAEAPIGAYAMSDVSRKILLERVDTAAIRARRRRNFQALAGALPELGVLPALPAGVVPLGFPIRTANRDALRRTLFAAEIFPPVHWPLDDRIGADFEASHQLAREIMTLPCDQRYDPEDMKRMASLVRREASP